MKSLVSCLCLSVVLAACGGDTQEEAPIVISTVEPDQGLADEGVAELTGAELFALHCETCHGPDGAGGATWPGAIQGLEVVEIATQGRATMAAVAVDRGEAERIQEFLDSFGVDQAALSGREIFANRCAPCHGDTGEGTALSLPIRFMHPTFSEWLVRNGRDTRDFAGPMPAYTVDEISDAQLAEMTDFMWAQPWPGAGEALYTAFCNNCHGPDGHSGYGGHDITRESSVVGIVRRGHGGTAYSFRTNYMPSWSTDLLSDYEVDQIDQYVHSL